MKRYLGCLLIISTLLLLSACASLQQKSYTFTPPTSETGKVCVTQCQQSRTLCRLQFKRYVAAQQAAKQSVDNAANTCQQDYRSCYQLCGGTIGVDKKPLF